MTSHAATRLPRAADFDWKGRGRELSVGGLAGVAVFYWSHQYFATFGTSLASTSAMAVAVGCGIFLEICGHSVIDRPRLGPWSAPAAWLTIAAWSVLSSWFLGVGRWLIGLVPVATLANDLFAICLMLVVATGLFIVPVAACLYVADSMRRSPSSTTQPISSLFLLGAGFGLAGGPSILAPLLGLEVLMIGITAMGAVGFWRSLMQAVETSDLSSSEGRTRNDSRCESSAHSVRNLSPWTLGLSLLIGLQVPLCSALVLRLMPGSPFEHDAIWAGLLGGVACGLLWAGHLRHRSRSAASSDGPLAAAILATVWPIVILSVWGLLVETFLSINSSISTVPLIMFLRMSVAALATAPLGVALGRLYGSEPTSRSSMALAIGCAVAGIVLMSAAVVPSAAAMAVLSMIAMMIAAGRYWSLGLPTLERRQQVAGALTVLAVAMLPLVRSNYRPDVAAKLLFSTNTFSALQSGISRDLLPHLDDGRLVAMQEGRDATWTVWKHRGSQLSLRENGLPRGMVSVDRLTSPQFAGELMPAVLPMVLHDRPDSVLVLGLGSTVPLSSLLTCPVKLVTCVEEDTALIGLVDQVLAPAIGVNPLQDDRVRLLNIDPTLALLSNGERHDVLIVNESQPSVMGAASGFTSEFYRAARAALNDGGLLCQRLQYADLGREPIEDLLCTVQTAFRQVALFDAAPGEMLVVATDREGALVDEATIARSQTPHIRNLMAQLGWDWSVLMNVAAVSPEAVSRLTAANGTPNTVSNGRFAYGLPQEVMRWSPPQLPKWQERQQLLTSAGSSMLAWLGESEQVKEIQQRLADVIEQQRLIHEHPDHFWAYRKTLKERLKDRPRGIIQQVKHEGLKRTLHPEDERRKAYLEVLGQAASSDAPQAAAIEKLTDFAVPYDPLVSHFLHQEAARLYEKSPDDDPAARFQHLRYSVYFGPPGDRSVRNVVAALTLVNDHPELIADPVARWDEMNSLLEVLKQRSSLRLRFDTTAAPFELIDAERSITIAKRTMTAMDALREQTGVPAEDWQHRRTVLERMLVRPMWTYHSQQAARLAKHHARSKALKVERDADTETR